MSTDLKRRLQKLEDDYTGPILQGFIQLDDAGELFGVATFYDEPDPDLTTWLRTFTPKLESVVVFFFTDYPDPDRTHRHTVPASELHPSVRELLQPYRSPGMQLHLIDGEKGNFDSHG